MAKKLTLERDGFRTVWYIDPNDRTMINVDVYQEGETPLLEWTYPKVVGNSILGNASFWLEQVVMQAKAELQKAAA